jgi:diguanylate cyclase (GGDEF)-like protein
MDKTNILIIDDDPSLRKTLVDILRVKGYETLAAADGTQGLALLRENDVKVALVDLGLPDASGIDVLSQVKAERPGTEAIILTGNATLDTAIEATNRGAFSYLLKPYDIDQLLQQIQRALEKQQASEQVMRRSTELERRNAELKILHELSLATGRTTDLDELLFEVLHALARTAVFPFTMKGAIFVTEGEGMRLGSYATLSEEFLNPCKGVCLDQCLCGIALATEEIVVSQDSRTDHRHTVCNPAMPSHGHIIVPLKADEKSVGVLCLYTPPDFAPDAESLGLLAAIGDRIAVGIRNVRLYEETRSSSLHDPLTGLANRRFLELQLDKIVETTRRYGNLLSLVMMDIDHFKKYNDTHGHLEGDRLLTKLAAILIRETRHADYVFRYGGEEFLVILPDTGLEMAAEAADRLRQAVAQEAGVTISLGVAAYRRCMPDKEALIRKADEALYLAKQNGRNRVEVSSQGHPANGS